MELKAGSMAQAEGFFHFLLTSFLGVRSERLCREMWRAYPKSQTLLYQLSLCGSRASTDLESIARVKRLGELINPTTLTRTVEKLVPRGRQRPPEVVELEERILYATNKDGAWRW
jgi:hypothetical protein